jgi:hypothetical protein
MSPFESMEPTKTVAEYPNGYTITEGSETGTFYVAPEPTDNHQFAPVSAFDTEREARLWVDVQTVTGGFSERSVGDRGVPPEVAVAPTRVTVSYLISQGYSTDEVARLCDTKRGSIHTYTSRVRRDAEQHRE